MTEQPEAKKAPLIERLETVPAYARLTIHDGHYSTSYYPVGAMAHEAAAELRRLQTENERLGKLCDDFMGQLMVLRAEKQLREAINKATGEKT